MSFRQKDARHPPFLPLVGLVALVAGTAVGCSGAPTTVASVMMTMLGEEEVLDSTCKTLRSDTSDAGEGGAVSDRMRVDLDAQVASVLRALPEKVPTPASREAPGGIAPRTAAALKDIGIDVKDCDPAALLAGGEKVKGCVSTLKNVATSDFGKRASINFDQLISDPKAFARRFDFGKPLVRLGIRVADESETGASRIAALVPFVSPAVEVVLRELAAEIVALGFDEA